MARRGADFFVFGAECSTITVPYRKLVGRRLHSLPMASRLLRHSKQPRLAGSSLRRPAVWRTEAWTAKSTREKKAARNAWLFLQAPRRQSQSSSWSWRSRILGGAYTAGRGYDGEITLIGADPLRPMIDQSFQDYLAGAALLNGCRCALRLFLVPAHQSETRRRVEYWTRSNDELSWMTERVSTLMRRCSLPARNQCGYRRRGSRDPCALSSHSRG